MSELGGDGPLCIAVMWSLTFIVFVFLLIRVYTRVVCVAAYGIDDHFYLLSMILTILYSTGATIAALHGYGRKVLTPAQEADTTYWRMIAQSFSLIVTATSKACVGFFLLRLVVVRWQRISIYAIMSVMGFLGIINVFFTWLACSPLPYAFDERVNGTCFDTKYPAIMLAMGTIAVDLYFAILPWIFIWKLNLPRREKFTIAGSLSLGFLAAVAGGIRVLNVKGVRNVPVPVIIWSQVETSLTLICVAIPVCRPLWSRYLSKWWHSVRQGSSYERQSEQQANNDSGGSAPIGLNTIGGGRTDGSHPSQDWKKKQGVWSSIMSISRAEDEGGERRVDDAESDEINLTGETRRENGDGRSVKNSWALGQSLIETTAGSQGSSTADDQERRQDGRVISGTVAKTYSITRS